jgi:hypothetical protein
MSGMQAAMPSLNRNRAGCKRFFARSRKSGRYEASQKTA